MITRDILNLNGDVIGSLSLPDEATEEQWTIALTAYTTTPVIRDVTARQIRQALIAYGVSMTSIETALDSLPEPQKSLAHIEWEYSNMFQRNRPLTLQVAMMLGWTSDQLDTLWLYAGTL